eukprot:TRINITY_DN80957_c0_g1_i1.p1 TRINITY_DN80957_c0_g1~~TRINITY_DN80957_c0_g1_i1.p1  ORF type:complete len:230 (-),score=89.72 TRINITY_DN80957_c0_g1_i1:132-821(-)
MSKDSADDDDGKPGMTDALGRKVWDKDAYVEKAKNNIMFGPERIGKRKDPVIPLPSSQRTYLKGRTTELELDKNLGQMKVVTNQTIKPMQGGYWCSVCECLIKDSAAYLEHINGRRHNRNLGMNMKVEKVGVDRIKEKLKALKKEPEAVEPEDIAAKLKALEEEAEEKKRRKKDKKRKKKGGGGEDGEPAEKKARGEGEEGEEDEDEEAAEETEEQKMLRSMGLPTGFG